MNRKKEPPLFSVISKYRGFLMGCAILSILFFHFTEDCQLQKHGYTGLVRLFNRYIGSSGVDVFLFLSGFGLYYAWKKNPTYGAFLKRRFSKVLVPYALVAVPAWIWCDCFFKKIGFISFLKDISFFSFFSEGKTWYWYILMILFCYVIFPWVFDIFETQTSQKDGQMRLLAIFSFLTVTAVCLQLYMPLAFKRTNLMLLRLPIFFFGCYLGKASYEKQKITGEWVAFILLAAAMPLLRRLNGNILVIRYLLGWFHLALLAVLVGVLEWLEQHRITLSWLRKILELFGKYSLELYLVHVTVRGVMNYLGYPTSRIRYELLMLVISLALSWLLKWLSQKIIRLWERTRISSAEEKGKI